MIESRIFFYGVILALGMMVPKVLPAQHEHHAGESGNVEKGGSVKMIPAEAQPLLAQALRLKDALHFLGSSLSPRDEVRLKQLQDQRITQATGGVIQEILDPYCLAVVSINPESRVKVDRGLAPAILIQGGWTSYLIKIENDAGVTAKLAVESPNALPPIKTPSYDPEVKQDNKISLGQASNRFLELRMYHNRPLLPNLSGLGVEYAVLQIYSKDAGAREVEIGFNVGQGTQDIGFRNTINVLFGIKKSVKVIFDVKDDDGAPAMASFIITDGIEHILTDSVNDVSTSEFRLTQAQLDVGNRSDMTAFKVPKSLSGIYPLPGRRVAATDEYPDFFFQPQVYRSDGESVGLPPGKYSVAFTRGPEYIGQVQSVEIPRGVDSFRVFFRLKRWINMSSFGWYSADHHLHAAGCSHYESPEEGVPPGHMIRQIKGEDLGVGAVLTWGPGWYHQKGYFTGQTDTFSTRKNIMRYDVEVSGFPSSHAGHLVLLNLQEEDYPGSVKIKDWPSWTIPVLSWAKSQGALVGYAHSGWGLEPISPATALPNYVSPKMDGIGANEYIVSVTQGLVDFYSAGDTPAPWELNMWYHSLNCGFTTRLSGETDFPCIYDERVGQARSYFKPGDSLSFGSYIRAIKSGHSYVSDGRSHIMDFSVNGVEAGRDSSQLALAGPQTVDIRATVAAYLSPHPGEEEAEIRNKPLTEAPFWHVERARIKGSRKVPVELIVNGQSVDTVVVIADGKPGQIRFSYPIRESSWVAIRIFPSSHTNPIFISVAHRPIRVSKSIEWCRRAVDQCWTMKVSGIRPEERPAAQAAYDSARKCYDDRLSEAR